MVAALVAVVWLLTNTSLSHSAPPKHCPDGFCTNHGACIDGACRCDAGFTGAACRIARAGVLGARQEGRRSLRLPSRLHRQRLFEARRRVRRLPLRALRGRSMPVRPRLFGAHLRRARRELPRTTARTTAPAWRKVAAPARPATTARRARPSVRRARGAASSTAVAKQVTACVPGLLRSRVRNQELNVRGRHARATASAARRCRWHVRAWILVLAAGCGSHLAPAPIAPAVTRTCDLDWWREAEKGTAARLARLRRATAAPPAQARAARRRRSITRRSPCSIRSMAMSCSPIFAPT